MIILAAIVIAATTTGTASTEPARADQPHVVEVTPGHGDVVDAAAVREFRVRFDRDMSPRGQSACGVQGDWVQPGAAPRWEDDRTWVLPVRLLPGRNYSWSVNCPSFRNFRSADGAEAEPYPVTFRTLAENEAPEAPATPEGNRAAAAELRRLIDQHYSYHDRTDINWDDRFAEFADRLERAPSRAAFARLLAELLAPAADLHLWVEVNGATLGTHRGHVTPNFDRRLLEAAVPGLEWANGRIAAGRFEDGTGYLLVASWGGGSGEAELKPAHGAIDRLIAEGAPGLVLDVRPNGGGDELLARSIAARFTEKRTVYARNLIRDPDSPGGWRGPFDRAVEPDPARPRFTAPVAVLIGPVCMSSNESFIQMMRESAGKDRRVLIGGRTRGSSGRPMPHELPSGVRVVVPSWKDMEPDGAPLEGVGISPGIEVQWPDAPGRDVVIEAALRWLADEPRQNQK